MKYYEVLYGFIISAGRVAVIGEILSCPGDLDAHFARRLIQRGRIKPAEAAPAPPAKAAAPEKKATL